MVYFQYVSMKAEAFLK